MTYGDGVSDVNIRRLLDFHTASGLLATLTAVRPPGRFGALELDDGQSATGFRRSPRGTAAGSTAASSSSRPRSLDYIAGDSTVWEQEPLERLAREGQLAAYRHDGFWQPMDTLRDKRHLEELWRTGRAPWKTW